MTKVDYSSLSIDVLQEIVRQAELRLQAQFQTTIAADNRAMGVAAALATISVVLMTAAVAALSIKGVGNQIASACSISSAVLLVGVVIAVVSARAIEFNFPGSYPSNWDEEVAHGASFKKALSDMANHYDEMLKENNNKMNEAGFLFNLSLILSSASMVVAGFWVAAILTRVKTQSTY